MHLFQERTLLRTLHYLALSKAHVHLSQEAHEILKVVRICVYYMTQYRNM